MPIAPNAATVPTTALPMECAIMETASVTRVTMGPAVPFTRAACRAEMFRIAMTMVCARMVGASVNRDGPETLATRTPKKRHPKNVSNETDFRALAMESVTTVNAYAKRAGTVPRATVLSRLLMPSKL